MLTSEICLKCWEDDGLINMKRLCLYSIVPELSFQKALNLAKIRKPNMSRVEGFFRNS